MEIKQVGVVGMGTMGHQIGLVFARAGFKTVMGDQSADRVEEGLQQIKKFLSKGVEKGKLTSDEMNSILARIKTTASLSDFSEVDLVVEAVFEDITAKKNLFSQLDKLCPSHTILATNTSTLSITEIASATKRPDRCIGAHFLIPASLTPLVEITRGVKTSDETHQQVESFLKACGKETVTVNDSPGFVINRLYIPFLNEAFFLLEKGTASAEEIDLACVKGLGHPLGPLAASDASGLDVVLSCVESLNRQLGDKYKPAPLLVELVRKGELGRKTGKGVYRYAHHQRG